MYDPLGNTGKSKFVKLICVNRPTELCKISFGTSHQLRTALISAGPRKCYFIDIPRVSSKGTSLKSQENSESSLIEVLTLVEDAKNGFLTSSMWGRNGQLLMDPPHIVIFLQSAVF